MERLRKFKKGLTLIELIISIVLLSVVILTASTLLINFKKFYFDFVERQAELGEVSLGVLEEIVNRITISSMVYIPPAEPSRIYIWVDNTDPGSTADDTVHTYYLDNNVIRYKYRVNGGPYSASKAVAQHIALLNFSLQYSGALALNQVKINIGVVPPGSTQVNFETTVIARAHSA